jgi:hypothetical protein
MQTIHFNTGMPRISIDHWPNSSFVWFGDKRPDLLWQQYTIGKLPPHYPVPAVEGPLILGVWGHQLFTADDFPRCIKVWEK